MMAKGRNFKNKQKGAIISLILVFGGAFVLVLVGLLGFILIQLKQSQQKAAWENSLQIAEAGVNYYRWHLNHNKNDIQDGQELCCVNPPCASCGPYEHKYYDAGGKEVGSFSLEITPKRMCDEILGVYILSTGQTTKFSNYKRKVQAKYAATSVAEYSYLLNDGIWFGEDERVYGKLHSNSGIRMDGPHNSLVTSAVLSWICTSSFGCKASACPSGCVPFGANCKCNGVAGSSASTDLWQFPVPPFDFAGLTNDLSRMKSLAQSKGKYFPKSTDINSNGKGYHLILKNDGTFDLKIITSIGRVRGYNVEEGWHWDYHIIQEESDYQINKSLPATCGLIFIEDNLWIEGTTKGKTTVASANLINPFTDTGVVINNNLTYTNLSGSDSLSLITEKDILIPLYSPVDMVVQGIFVSQKGKAIHRNYYPCSWYTADCKKNDFTSYGSVVSYVRPAPVTWVYSNGEVASGYLNNFAYFDQKLALDPPPLLPYVSEDLQLISWEEVQ